MNINHILQCMFLLVCLQVGKATWCLEQANSSVMCTTAVPIKSYQERDMMTQFPALLCDVLVLDCRE